MIVVILYNQKKSIRSAYITDECCNTIASPFFKCIRFMFLCKQNFFAIKDNYGKNENYTED